MQKNNKINTHYLKEQIILFADISYFNKFDIDIILDLQYLFKIYSLGIYSSFALKQESNRHLIPLVEFDFLSLISEHAFLSEHKKIEKIVMFQQYLIQCLLSTNNLSSSNIKHLQYYFKKLTNKSFFSLPRKPLTREILVTLFNQLNLLGRSLTQISENNISIIETRSISLLLEEYIYAFSRIEKRDINFQKLFNYIKNNEELKSSLLLFLFCTADTNYLYAFEDELPNLSKVINHPSSFSFIGDYSLSLKHSNQSLLDFNLKNMRINDENLISIGASRLLNSRHKSECIDKFISQLSLNNKDFKDLAWKYYFQSFYIA